MKMEKIIIKGEREYLGNKVRCVKSRIESRIKGKYDDLKYILETLTEVIEELEEDKINKM